MIFSIGVFMRHFILAGILLATVGLTACSSAPDLRPGYGYSYEYNYEDNKPEHKPHIHYGIVEDVFYMPERYFGDVVTGTVLSHVITEDIIAVREGRVTHTTITRRPLVGYVQVLAIRLPGGDTLFSVQKSNSSFAVGQDVRILGTGTSHRVVDSE